MSELSEYVDRLFIKYEKDPKINDLKTEILGNLEAKKEDLISSGMEEAEAIKKSEESITSIDYLIDDNKMVYINRARLEFTQLSLITILIGWIMTIPLFIFRMGLSANLILFLAAAAIGIYYFFLWQKAKHNTDFMYEKRAVNYRLYRKRRNLIRILWGIFALISIFAVTMLHFASNIWFKRAVKIDGPYAFAVILIEYFVPLLTVIVPVIAGFPMRLILKYEAGDDDEK